MMGIVIFGSTPEFKELVVPLSPVIEYIQMIFTTSFYDTIIRVATPLLLATMGAVITSNAGITNIGL
ncbi:hypothetical protein PT100_08890, partial [Erysipelothrix rhusiopathiae]|nr:hypothetical protein [Erysipelothrix rhusiopathiae]